MTREEAKEIMCKVTFYWELGEQTLTQNQINEAIDMAIKALEQQPCEDAISRKAVLDMATSYYTDGWDTTPLVVDVEDIEELPSVTLQPKKGRWIRWYEVIESADGKSTDHIPHCKCSECSTKYDPHSSQFIKYCPNCGAKMEEVEE